MRHFCLARASNYHVERDIEMVQKLDNRRKVTVLRIRRRIIPSGCFGLDDCVKENFKSVCEENQMLVVRRERHRLLYLASCQMKTQNVM